MMNPRLATFLAGAVLMLAMGCGGGGSSSTPPTTTPTPPTGGGGGGDLPTSVTITIGANGSVSPANVTIADGGRVTFVNNNNQQHDLNTDPHTEHTDCQKSIRMG